MNMRLVAMGFGVALAASAFGMQAQAASVPAPVTGVTESAATDDAVVTLVRRGGGGGFRGGHGGYRGGRGYRGGGFYIYSAPTCWWSRRYHRTICSY